MPYRRPPAGREGRRQSTESLQGTERECCTCDPGPDGRQTVSDQDLFHHAAAQVGEALEASGVVVGELHVVQSQAVQDGGMQVVQMVDVFGGLDAQLVGGSDHGAPLDAGAGKPHDHGVLVVVAARMGAEEVHGVVGGAAELAAPDHQGFVEQPPPLEVLEETGHRLVGFQAPLAVL